MLETFYILLVIVMTDWIHTALGCERRVVLSEFAEGGEILSIHQNAEHIISMVVF